MTEANDSPEPPEPARRLQADGAPTRRRTRRTGIKPRRRGLITGAMTLIVLLLLAGGWIVFRGLGAVSSIKAARATVLEAETDFRQGNVAKGELASSRAGEQARRAHRLTNDPIWHLASHLPFIGSTMQTTTGLAAAASNLASTVLPAAGDAAGRVDGSSLRSADGGVNLVNLRKASDELNGIQTQLAQTTALVSALPPHTLIGSVGSARTSLLGTLSSVERQVGQIVTGSQLAISMLGTDGPRRYFLALQNPAEIRGTGGLVGSFAIVEADAGKISLIQTGSDNELGGTSGGPGLDLGAAFDAQWRVFQPTTDWRQSNFSPNFPDAATIWLSLWQRQTGQRIDGAIAIDPEVAGDMLTATGAKATLPDGTVLTGSQVADYTESTLYAKYGTENDARKKALVTLTQRIFDQLKAGNNARAVLAAVARGVGAGRVLVASAHPEEQAQLLATSVGGSLSTAPGPYAHVVVNNTGGNKVDYYLKRSISYDLGACTGTTRSSTVTVTLHNGAPATGLTPYVAGDQDGIPGTSVLYFTAYAAVGAHLNSATLNGAPIGMLQFQENGRPSFGNYASIKPGGTATLVLHLTEPSAGTFVPEVEQPLHVGGEIHVNDPPCG